MLEICQEWLTISQSCNITTSLIEYTFLVHTCITSVGIMSRMAHHILILYCYQDLSYWVELHNYVCTNCWNYIKNGLPISGLAMYYVTTSLVYTFLNTHKNWWNYVKNGSPYSSLVAWPPLPATPHSSLDPSSGRCLRSPPVVLIKASVL